MSNCPSGRILPALVLRKWAGKQVRSSSAAFCSPASMVSTRLLPGLGGASLTLFYPGSWNEALSSGQGVMAVALVMACGLAMLIMARSQIHSLESTRQDITQIALEVGALEQQVTVVERDKRIAGDVKKCLQSAIANAENNHNLDVDSLVVAEAWVGKNLVMKRGRPRARGRFGKIMKPFSELTIKLRQTGETA